MVVGLSILFALAFTGLVYTPMVQALIAQLAAVLLGSPLGRQVAQEPPTSSRAQLELARRQLVELPSQLLDQLTELLEPIRRGRPADRRADLRRALKLATAFTGDAQKQIAAAYRSDRHPCRGMGSRSVVRRSVPGWPVPPTH